MARALTSAMRQTVQSEVLRPFLLVELQFDSGTARYWSGIGDLEWSGVTWTGAGHVGKMTEVEETQDMRAVNVAFSVTGIDASLTSLALDDSYQGRPAKAWLGLFNNFNVIVANPYMIYSGLMDTQVIEEKGDTVDITINTESRLAELRNASNLSFTDQDQQSLHPGDKGLEFLVQLQSDPLRWRLEKPSQ